MNLRLVACLLTFWILYHQGNQCRKVKVKYINKPAKRTKIFSGLTLWIPILTDYLAMSESTQEDEYIIEVISVVRSRSNQF